MNNTNKTVLSILAAAGVVGSGFVAKDAIQNFKSSDDKKAEIILADICRPKNQDIANYDFNTLIQQAEFLSQYAQKKGWLKEGEHIKIDYDKTIGASRTNLEELNKMAEQVLKQGSRAR